MDIEVLCWIDRPGYKGVVIKEDGEMKSLDFTAVSLFLDKVDKEIWRRLCREKGYLSLRRTNTGTRLVSESPLRQLVCTV